MPRIPSTSAAPTYRPLYRIAKDIRQNWRNVNFAAKPYLQAMDQLNRIEDTYLRDTGKSIVQYLLANSQTWKGEAARRIKGELRAMLDGKPVPTSQPEPVYEPPEVDAIEYRDAREEASGWRGEREA